MTGVLDLIAAAGGGSSGFGGGRFDPDLIEAPVRRAVEAVRIAPARRRRRAIDARGRAAPRRRDTAEVVSGSREREIEFTERWTPALDGGGTWPWRIAAARVPAR